MKVLLTFTAPTPHFEEALQLCREKYGECSIYALVSERVEDRAKSYKELSGYITFKGRFFNLFLFLAQGFITLNRMNFDSIVILYNNPFGGGYLQLELMAFLSKAKNISYITLTNDFRHLTLLPWLKKRLVTLESYNILDTFLAATIFSAWMLRIIISKVMTIK